MFCMLTHRELAFKLCFISQSTKQIVILLSYCILNWDGKDGSIFLFRERHSGIIDPGLEAGESMKVTVDIVYSTSHILPSETLYNDCGDIAGHCRVTCGELPCYRSLLSNSTVRYRSVLTRKVGRASRRVRFAW